MRETQNIGNQRPPLRSTPRRSDVHRTRKVMVHGRGPQRRRKNAAGYQLQRHPINFSGRRSISRLNPWTIILGALGLVVVILVVVLITSALSQCQGPQAPADTVSADAPASVRDDLAAAVERDGQLDAIAADAGSYPEGLIALALAEPDAVAFVHGWPQAEKTFGEFGSQSLAKNEVPTLMTWDTRWGYGTYGDGPMALTGSGPVAMAAATMGLLGTTDHNPAAIAQAAMDAQAATGDSGTAASFFVDKAADLGVTVEELKVNDATDQSTGTDGQSSTGSDATTGSDGSADSDASSSAGTQDSANGTNAASSKVEALLAALDGGYVLVETDGKALGDSPHWLLVCAKDTDGVVTLMDPTSTENNGHGWDPASVVAHATTLLKVSAPTTAE